MELVDGSQVWINAPHPLANEVAFVNRKLYHSINVQIVCNSKMLINDLDARWPGSTHDSFMLQNSHVMERFENGQIPNTWLLGDAGYGQIPNTWLLGDASYGQIPNTWLLEDAGYGQIPNTWLLGDAGYGQIPNTWLLGDAGCVQIPNTWLLGDAGYALKKWLMRML